MKCAGAFTPTGTCGIQLPGCCSFFGWSVEMWWGSNNCTKSSWDSVWSQVDFGSKAKQLEQLFSEQIPIVIISNQGDW